MARYLDVDKISRYIRKNFSIDKTKNADICFAFIDLMNWLDDQPTADVVEVVRCKDCMHKKRGIQGKYCGLTDFLIKDDDFCSFGERRDT